MEPTVLELRAKLLKVTVIIRNQEDRFKTPALVKYRENYYKSLRKQLKELTEDKLFQLPNLANC